jgi:hypothetical protein
MSIEFNHQGQAEAERARADAQRSVKRTRALVERSRALFTTLPNTSVQGARPGTASSSDADLLPSVLSRR